jgi:hypothetical protein
VEKSDFSGIKWADNFIIAGMFFVFIMLTDFIFDLRFDLKSNSLALLTSLIIFMICNLFDYYTRKKDA